MPTIDFARTKISHIIIASLREQILAGRYPVASKLPSERLLAEEFNVSQPTMREAIRALDAMGLVDVRHGSGTYVRHDPALIVTTALQALLQLDRVSLLSVLEVRAVLGTSSAARVAQSASDADLDRIEEALDELGKLDTCASVEDVINRTIGFQTAICELSGNPFLSRLESLLIILLLQVQLRALRSRGLSYWIGRSTAFQSDRKAILEALRSRDPAMASQAMTDYFDHQTRVFKSDPELVRMRFTDSAVVAAVSDILIHMRTGREAPPSEE
ncbi:FadR/GntR family transcriptional regulator [Sphingobium sp. DC-2]|uniref:FadR/GntR family transcriptional regulator n=1 Tax=Sphingobium sp. DC-2 TaxID=1303256 RepID=UPI00068E97B4|nr:FadR/GntR family transcriptional regulator [Sphingobium sp. DC-2]